MPALIAFLIFVAVLLLMAAVTLPILQRRAMKERLQKMMTLEGDRQVLVAPPTKLQFFLAGLGRKLRMKQEELFQYRELLVAAGFKKDSLYVFLGMKLFLAVALPAVYLLLVVLSHGRLAGDQRFVIILAGCGILGFLLPTLWLRRRVARRKTEIFHMLPDVLDLLTVSVEAGLNLDAALIKTTENVKHKSNPLIQEIETLVLEMRAGKPRPEALKALASRTMVDDLKYFVAMLIQTEKFGTSLGQTLRTFSDSLRLKRKQVAEEAAAKTAIKMLVPLTTFIFPSLLVVLLVPAFFKFITYFKH